MTHITCRLTAKNQDQLRNRTLGNRVWATFLWAASTDGQLSPLAARHCSTFVCNVFIVSVLGKNCLRFNERTHQNKLYVRGLRRRRHAVGYCGCTQMNILGNVKEPFLGEDRFEVTFTTSPPRYGFHLFINGRHCRPARQCRCV